MSTIKKIALPILLFIFSTSLTALGAYFTTIIDAQNRVLLFFIFLFLVVILFVAFWFISSRNNLLDVRQKITKSQWKTIFSSLGLILLSIIAINTIFPQSTSTNQSLIISDLENSLPIMSLYLLSAPFFEEIIFRGFIYQNLFNKSLIGLFVSLSIFISLHITSLEDLTLKSILSYLIPALLFTFVYKKTNRLECAILLHFFQNLMPLLISYLILLVEGTLSP